MFFVRVHILRRPFYIKSKIRTHEDNSSATLNFLIIFSIFYFF